MFVCCSQGWIHEKAKLIESTDELGNDLAGVMTLQRRLSTMERDLAAIQAKVSMGLFPATAGTVLVTWRTLFSFFIMLVHLNFLFCHDEFTSCYVLSEFSFSEITSVC